MNTTRTAGKFLRTAGGAVLVATLLILCLGSLAWAKKDQDAAKPQDQADPSKLMWPPPPDVPRIKFLQTVFGEESLNPSVTKKKKASMLDKMAGVSLPAESTKPRTRGPYGVAGDSKGHIYVADVTVAAVFNFDFENKKVNLIGYQKLKVPSGVAIDDADRIFVVDSGQDMIFVFRTDGSLEGSFGHDKLVRPVGIAIDNENRFAYVVDSMGNRVAVFDADSYRFLRYVGKPKNMDALEPGVFERPTNVALDSEGNVYISDTFNARVQVFDADGTFLRTWGKPGSTAGYFMRPKGIAVDADDHVYVVDSEFNNVQVFDTEGNILMYFGTRGDTPGTFTLVSGIGIDKQNRVVVTEQWTGRVQIFRYITDAEAKPEYDKMAAEAAKHENEATSRETVVRDAPAGDKK
jgi:streptogramin lyase